ncbi:unnamed protein product [Linum tenue]|uniref:Uncharacterized protein n=1 Tax=Linum tenue TaxID=586396 RepID=A0AAV0H5H9_9ROSI|nr:unnamed protein product [Linum tenue]
MELFRQRRVDLGKRPINVMEGKSMAASQSTVYYGR